MNHRYDPDYPSQDYDMPRDDRRRQEENRQRDERARHAGAGDRSEAGYYGAGRVRASREPENPYDPYAPLQGRPPEERHPERDDWQRPQRPNWQDSNRSIDHGTLPNGRSAAGRSAYREQVWGDPNSGYLYVTGGLSGPGGVYGSSGEAERWRSSGDELGVRAHLGRGQSGRSTGHHGKGPKGYTRSDERIREDVSDRLSDDDEVDASDITVTVSNAEVRLEGTVSDRHTKHRAEDIAESVSGVREVSNHLRTRKTFFQEIGDKIAGEDKVQHQGHAGSGTHNGPKGGLSTSH